jgi:hypothetical protein
VGWEWSGPPRIAARLTRSFGEQGKLSRWRGRAYSGWVHRLLGRTSSPASKEVRGGTGLKPCRPVRIRLKNHHVVVVGIRSTPHTEDKHPVEVGRDQLGNDLAEDVGTSTTAIDIALFSGLRAARRRAKIPASMSDVDVSHIPPGVRRWGTLGPASIARRSCKTPLPSLLHVSLPAFARATHSSENTISYYEMTISSME